MTTDLDEHYIRKNIEWDQLPTEIRRKFSLNTEKDYEKVIVSFSIKNQLRYKGNLVRKIQKDPRKYYEDLLRYSREHLMIFPYHLSEIYVKGLRITSFSYYIDMISDLILQEKSYDTLPNFTAADCLRLLGIGRNQYIELINQSRTIVQGSKKKIFMNFGSWKSQTSIRHLLPTQPVDSVSIQPWWMIHLGCVTDEDVKQCSSEEKLVIDYLIDEKSSKLAGELNYGAIHKLYRKGLIYLEIPVDDEDLIKVPPLGSGFVMNRIVGDYFEVLLYKLFVSIDEHTNVGELSRILNLEIELVKQTMSMFLRLGFAQKKNLTTDFGITHTSWKDFSISIGNLQSPPLPKELDSPTRTVDQSILEWKAELDLESSNVVEETADDQKSLSSTNGNQLLDVVSSSNSSNSAKQKRIGFLFDSSLTAFLMMGNLSSNLKTHAVTMFEVGKLADEILGSFLEELEKITNSSKFSSKSSEEENQSEGEADRYFVHARVLYKTLSFLRLNKEIFDQCLGVDLLRYESLSSLDVAVRQRLIERNYQILISMAPISAETSYSPFDSIDFLGPSSQEMNSVWMKLFLYHLVKSGPATLLLPKGSRLNSLPKCLKPFEKYLVTTWNHEPTFISNVNILLSINDALLHSAVLIQAFSNEINSNRDDQQRIRHFPFPFEQNEKISIVENLSDSIDLQNISGYLTFLNYSSNPNDEFILDIRSKNEIFLSKNKNSISNVFFSFHFVFRFGIPLFDEKLSESIRNRFIQHDLCAIERVEQRLKNLRSFSSNLLDFIDQFQSSDSAPCNNFGSLSSKGIRSTPLPQRAILFDGKNLIKLESTDFY